MDENEIPDTIIGGGLNDQDSPFILLLMIEYLKDKYQEDNDKYGEMLQFMLDEHVPGASKFTGSTIGGIFGKIFGSTVGSTATGIVGLGEGLIRGFEHGSGKNLKDRTNAMQEANNQSTLVKDAQEKLETYSENIGTSTNELTHADNVSNADLYKINSQIFKEILSTVSKIFQDSYNQVLVAINASKDQQKFLDATIIDSKFDSSSKKITQNNKKVDNIKLIITTQCDLVRAIFHASNTSFKFANFLNELGKYAMKTVDSSHKTHEERELYIALLKKSNEYLVKAKVIDDLKNTDNILGHLDDFLNRSALLTDIDNANILKTETLDYTKDQIIKLQKINGFACAVASCAMVAYFSINSSSPLRSDVNKLLIEAQKNAINATASSDLINKTMSDEQ